MSLLILCRLVPSYHVSKSIGYAIRKQFYKPIHCWGQLNPESDYNIVKAEWFAQFGVSICQIEIILSI